MQLTGRNLRWFMTQKSDLQVVSLFSGCGGLDFGFEAAGFNITFSNDHDQYSCDTLVLNKRCNVFNSPIEEITGEEVKQVIGTKKGTCDVLIGGPPCQPFSKSAYWNGGDTKRLKDPRANTLDQYFRFVEDLLPQVFLIENVHGMNYKGKEEGFNFIIDRISEINMRYGVNYSPSWSIINVADYGVPQIRVRFFMIAFKNGKRFHFPRPTHAPTNIKSSTFFNEMKLQPYITAWEAIGDIAETKDQNLNLGGKWADLLPSIPEGENYLWHTERKGGLPLFGWRTRYWSFLLKLSKRLPSWTIQAQPGSAIGPFHWKNRRLSWQEMAAIQTFPKSFKIEAPRTEAQKQIGNAVPSLMSEILAREIASQYFEKCNENQLSLSILRNKNIPQPEIPKKVPQKYLHLIGKHPEHPGTNKGRYYQQIMNR